jgi:SAM-dependent methyltransferase
MPDPRVRDLSARYAREARAYKELWAPVLRPLGTRLVGELRGSTAKRILDIGAGTGSLLSALREAFPEASVVGVDRSPGMLALAPRDTPLAVMDAARLAFAPDSFDLLILAFMLFHLPDPGEGLTEARRVLRPGGRVGTVTWGSDFESEASRAWNAELDAHGADPLDADVDLAHHELVDTPEKMKALLGSSGFTDAHAWLEDYEHRMDPNYLVRLRTGVGRNKRRFDSLEPSVQAACLDSARRRLAALGPEDFVARGKIVYAVARIP